MTIDPWSSGDSYDEPYDLPDSDVLISPREDYEQGLSGRQLKAAAVLVAVWSIVIGLHLVSWGRLAVLALSLLLALQAFRVIGAEPEADPPELADWEPGETAALPIVALLVAAKDEAAVIGRLVDDLCTLDYPSDRLEVWIIDDNSQDNTAAIVKAKQSTYPQLRMFRRSAQASGGKSGALNQVWPQTQAEILAIFDADARVPRNLLRRVVPFFDTESTGAVQVRKIIANAEVNLLTRGQAIEMVLDSYFQQQRTTIDGIGELRGNGEFLRRRSLEGCGGFNEETITDDLDLTIRLNLDRQKVRMLLDPGVDEEGVTSLKALWHQRNRWAEGGFQRYLDYWRLIAANRMGTLTTIDLLGFLIIQYLLPMAMLPDFVMALARHRLPILTPLSSFTIILPTIAILVGLRRVHRARYGCNPPLLGTIAQISLGLIYMLHWLVIMVSVTGRMALRPKQLKWVKTVHGGGSVA
jgi:1,2-diacylglycerol 3-beta-glucosyltransferase